ncbi:hypothetical protein FOA52_016131 [Chlamydomonas sp. UWO 241]|nr:hypothetical protein FOA52_016131 [Chlamydomonas sp. UWO 241]
MAGVRGLIRAVCGGGPVGSGLWRRASCGALRDFATGSDGVFSGASTSSSTAAEELDTACARGNEVAEWSARRRQGIRMDEEEAMPSGLVAYQDMLKQSVAGGRVGRSPVIKASHDVSSVAAVIFDACWRKFEEQHDIQTIWVPREVVWLNGPPGCGKGANTNHILATRGLEASISVSALLKNHPDSRDFIERGEMLPDKVVGDVLLRELLVNSCSSPECGVLVDGFPRTALQVDFLKCLADKFTFLHTAFAGTSREAQFPRPLFKVVLLYVTQETSIQRQMARAQMVSMHNVRARDAGAENYKEMRATDVSIETCKKRYAIYKSHYPATLRLKQFFPFHLIDAMGTLSETQEAVVQELRYQSSLDLDQATFQCISHLPLSSELVSHARQQLVSRLDNAADKHPLLFQNVIDVLTAEVMPVLRESGMAGQLEFSTDLRLFNEHPRCSQILVDVLTDRGFKTSHTIEVSHVPVHFDLSTGQVQSRSLTKHRFLINWDTRSVRDQALENDARVAGGGGGGELGPAAVRISQSFVPGGGNARAPAAPSPALRRNLSNIERARAALDGDDEAQQRQRAALRAPRAQQPAAAVGAMGVMAWPGADSGVAVAAR